MFDVSPSWSIPVLDAVTDLLHLRSNWDGYGAIPPTQHMCATVLGVLRGLMEDESPPPTLVPGFRGGIQAEWHRGGIDLEIEFHPDGRIEASVDDRRTGDSWEGEIDSQDERIKRVIHVLTVGRQSSTD